MATKKHYGANQIRILENLEPVRQNPGMYVGDTGVEGLHHIVEEVVSNAVDEYMDGHVTAIGVKIDTEKQVVTIIDNGRGIPVTKHKKTSLPMLTAVLTKLHSGGKFGQGAYTSAVAGLHGVGVKATNALSERLIVRTVQNGKVYQQTFEKGVPITKVVRSKKRMRFGTRVEFRPDFTIFKRAKLDPKIVRSRLRDIAYLCPGLIIEFKVNSDPIERFHAKDGLLDMLKNQTDGLTYLHDPIIIQDDVVDAVLVWTDRAGAEKWSSFVNVTHTPDLGVHVLGAEKAIQKVFSDHSDGKYGRLLGRDVRDGLVAIVHAHVLKPEFRGQTKRSLQNHEVKESVERVVDGAMRKFAAANPDTMKSLLQNAVYLRDERKKYRLKQKAVRGTKVAAGARNVLPGKLCSAPDCPPDKRELYIVEGDSAFGTVKQARLTLKNGVHYQEILPLRGKVLNAAQAGGVGQVLKNAELSNVTQAIGASIDPSFDLKKCRYRAVYLLMDADTDGHHIQALLLAFFAKHMPELIKAGRLFVVESPLYMGVTAKQRVFGNSLDDIKKQVGNTKNVRITRFKGLGESGAKALRVYAMNDKTRDTCQVIWGGKSDQEQVMLYMGLDAAARKELLNIVE